MSFPRILFLASLLLFGVIGAAAFFKKKGEQETLFRQEFAELVEVEPESAKANVLPSEVPSQSLPPASVSVSFFNDTLYSKELPFAPVSSSDTDSQIDRIEEFFNKRGSKLPIVETITYKSRAPWLKGRSAWVADYASHYKTSRHFIARSLNGKLDYEKQDVSDGVRFNVLRNDIDFEFYLLVDLQTRKLLFYYWDKENDERVLLKTYVVGLGRPDSSSPSRSLTPIGKYRLGDKIAIYRPKSLGIYQGKRIEMVRVFGTRWIPFSNEIEDSIAPAEGLGIHGLPLLPDEKGELVENLETLGKFESDGCIRLTTKDVEELFSIVISRPTTLEIVESLSQAKPPGKPFNRESKTL